MSEHAYAHVPLMAGRIAALLLPALTGPTPGGRPPVLIDATLGRAGHARAFLDAVPELRLIGIDADAAAIDAGRALAERYPGRVTVAHAFYDRIAEIAADAGHRRVQGVLFDLGVSSPQLDDASRGFASPRAPPPPRPARRAPGPAPRGLPPPPPGPAGLGVVIGGGGGAPPPP